MMVFCECVGKHICNDVSIFVIGFIACRPLWQMEFEIKFNEIFKLKIQTKDNVDAIEIDVGYYLPKGFIST